MKSSPKSSEPKGGIKNLIIYTIKETCTEDQYNPDYASSVSYQDYKHQVNRHKSPRNSGG